MPKRKNSAPNEKPSKKPDLKVESNTLTAVAVADVSQRDLLQLFPLDVWGEVISHLSSVRDLLSFASVSKQSKDAVEKKFPLDSLRNQLRFMKERGIYSPDSKWLKFPQKPYEPKFLKTLQRTGFTMQDYPFAMNKEVIPSLINMLREFMGDKNVLSPDFQKLISSTIQKDTLDFSIYQHYKQAKHHMILGAAEFLWDCKPYVVSLIEAASKIKNNKKDPTFIEINQEVEKIYQLQYPILLLFSLDLIFRTVSMSKKSYSDDSYITFLLVSTLGMLHATKFNMSYATFFYQTISKKLHFLKAKQSEDIKNQKLLKNIEDLLFEKLKKWCEIHLPLTARAYAQSKKDFNQAVRQVIKIMSADRFKQIALDSISSGLDQFLSSPPLFGKLAAKCTLTEIFDTNTFLGKLIKCQKNYYYAQILETIPNLTPQALVELFDERFENPNLSKDTIVSYGTVLFQSGYAVFFKLALTFEAPDYSNFSSEKIKKTILHIIDKHHDKIEHLRSLVDANISSNLGFFHTCQSFVEFMTFEKMYHVVTEKKSLFHLYAILTKTKQYLMLLGCPNQTGVAAKNARVLLPLLNATKADYFEAVWEKVGIELPLVQKYLIENSAQDKSWVLMALSHSNWEVLKAKILLVYGPKIPAAYQQNNPHNYFQSAPSATNVPQVTVVQATQNNPANLPGNRL